MSNYLDKTASLVPMQKTIIIDKATEYPHTGQYTNKALSGTYLCRRCGFALFRGDQQFNSSCGWPSFDGPIAQAIKEIPDEDGQRMELLCTTCNAHLGHVFRGEHLTAKNVRYCVNSASLDFVDDNEVHSTEEAIVAGGCFWGVEHYLRQLPGVLLAESGYTGGHLLNPTYQQISQGTTGHYEAVRVLFDSTRIDYYTVIKHFFEIHDPTQKNGQGPDIGSQYQSAIFYYNEAQKDYITQLLNQLKQNGYAAGTKVLPVQPFWPAEEYHQAYYTKHNKTPYCHRVVQRFIKS